MNTFRLTVSSPDGQVFSGQAIGLFLRGADGDLAVLAGHIPLITAVRPGEVRVELPEDAEEDWLIGETTGGLLTVGPDAVVLLTTTWKAKAIQNSELGIRN